MSDNKKKRKQLDDIDTLIDEIAQREFEKSVIISSIIAERIGEIAMSYSPTVIPNLLSLKRTHDDIALIHSELERIQNEQIKSIKNVIEQSAKQSYKATEQRLLNAKPKVDILSYKQNKAVQDEIKNIQTQAVEEYVNTYKTQAFMLRDRKNPKLLISTEASEAYQDIVDEAMQAIKSGENYTTIMRRTVEQLAESGIRRVQYEAESGKRHTQRTDTAVKRNVMDSVRQANQIAQNEVGKLFNADGVELSVHQYPAPDHAPVQGHQFTHEEFAKMQNGYPFKDVQGRQYEGFKRPIGMWNCKHFTKEILIGEFPQTYSDEELAKILQENEKGYTAPDGKHLTFYKCTQKQRQLETKIRYAKEGKIVSELAGDKQLTDKYQAEVARLTKEYQAFSRACGIKPDFKNIYVKGYKS